MQLEAGTRLGHYELMERHLIAPFIDEGAN